MILSKIKIELAMAEHKPAAMSQGDLAGAFGCHQSVMSKLLASVEAGEEVAPVRAARLAEALGVTVRDLLAEAKEGEAA